MDLRQRIVDEIRRTAKKNGGKPLGRERFVQETGIKLSDWEGKIWVRWSDAAQEAGLQPNQLNTAYDEEVLFEKYINFARQIKHLPLHVELKMNARDDPSFPAANTFVTRFGQKLQLIERVRAYCSNRPGYEDILGFCEAATPCPSEKAASVCIDNGEGLKAGTVYLMLMETSRDRVYKIGHSVLVERRRDQMAPHLPAKLELIHEIRTDDAYGIEKYWHNRFKAKRTNGEWFALSRQDVDAFKQRKFM